ncbi:MAG TPA: hypothetical protein VN089_00075 [Duganella sp.]|nr:hypothetical protein [Duganella sp.]
MPFNIHFSSPRVAATAVIGGCLLIAAGGYFMSRGEHRADQVDAPHVAGSGVLLARAPTASGAQAALSAGTAAVQGAPASAPADASAVKLLTPAETAESLRAFVDKIRKRENLTSNEVEELQARLLASIEGNLDIVKVVQQFYHNMPAEQGMERDMLRSLLVASPAGRSIVLQEADTIWEDKSVSKFAEMYETYFNMPGQVPQDVIVRALADLKAGAPADDRTAVARLNFIGTLADQKNGDAANLRSDAVQLLNQLAESPGSEIVRALAVQKLYRLSSPAEASNIAIAQLSKGAYGDLVRETLSSVNSGDVELTPNLRGALTTAVKRPAASAEEKQLFSQVLGPRS